uniref:Uncharacterized protein n=1 Tax=Monodelphis domestica TaxID=13616 RepID=A0A5F8G4F7_MONDO
MIRRPAQRRAPKGSPRASPPSEAPGGFLPRREAPLLSSIWRLLGGAPWLQPGLPSCPLADLGFLKPPLGLWLPPSASSLPRRLLPSWLSSVPARGPLLCSEAPPGCPPCRPPSCPWPGVPRKAHFRGT